MHARKHKVNKTPANVPLPTTTASGAQSPSHWASERNMGRGSTPLPPRHLSRGSQGLGYHLLFPLTPIKAPARLVPKGLEGREGSVCLFPAGIVSYGKIRALWTRNVDLCSPGEMWYTTSHINLGWWGRLCEWGRCQEGRLEVVGEGCPGKDQACTMAQNLKAYSRF